MAYLIRSSISTSAPAAHVIFEPMDCAPGKTALILQAKVLSWKVKLAAAGHQIVVDLRFDAVSGQCPL
jgi:hypothetical protein